MGLIRIAAALGFVFFSTACDREATDEPGDILLVTIDTLRADHLGLYGYERPTSPQIDRLFRDSAVFERAYSTEANTSPSIVSLLTGLSPPEHRVRLLYQLLPEELQLLPELLPETYQSAAFVANVVLTDEAIGLANRFDHYDDQVDEKVFPPGQVKVYERSARGTTDAALAWLREKRDPDRPLFLWIHYIDPHQPYDAPAGAAPIFEHEDPIMVPARRLRIKAPRNAQVDGLDTVDAYDREIAYLDSEVGRFLTEYGAMNPLDDAMVVFTADHAESMMEHEFWFTHGYQVYEEIVRVPLLLRGPGVRPGRYTTLSSGIDIAPTLLRFAGVEPPAEWAGFDLRAPERIAKNRVVFAEASYRLNSVGHWRMAVQGSQKWIVGMKRGQRAIEERRFYDLEADPFELNPISWNPGEVADRLLELSESDPDPGGLPEAAKEGLRVQAPKVAPRATPEQLEQLRALGYVE